MNVLIAILLCASGLASVVSAADDGAIPEDMHMLTISVDHEEDNEDEGDVRAGGCGGIDQELAAGEFHDSLFRGSRRLTTSINSAAEASTWSTKLLMIPVK